MKKIIIVILIFIFILLSGCTKEISKTEAEQVAYDYMYGIALKEGVVNDIQIKVMNSYKEKNYWKVMVGFAVPWDEGSFWILEINTKTGKVEYFSNLEGEKAPISALI